MIFSWLPDHLCRALRVLKSADVILSEDTRHSGKLLQYYNIKTPLVRVFSCFPLALYIGLHFLFMFIHRLKFSLEIQMSYHKFNESQREQVVLKRLKQGELVALISDAGTPGISDPGTELVSNVVPWLL